MFFKYMYLNSKQNGYARSALSENDEVSLRRKKVLSGAHTIE